MNRRKNKKLFHKIYTWFYPIKTITKSEYDNRAYLFQYDEGSCQTRVVDDITGKPIIEYRGGYLFGLFERYVIIYP